jgi:glycerophosphoryl diester phosphodiesterase
VGRKRVLAAELVGAAVAALRKEKRRSLNKDWPTNFAHRGASSRAPENTLEAFRIGAESGAGGLELDIHMTSDGRIVVIHDDSVDRTTNGEGFVRDVTLREVQSLDAGYRFTLDGGATYPYQGQGVRVPGLEEIFWEFPDQAVNIDITEAQPGVEAALLRTIAEAGAGERVLVVSEMSAVVERFRKLSGGGISTGASRRDIKIFYRLSMLHLEFLLHPSYDALQVPAEYGGRAVVTPRFVEAAYNRGVRVDVWTIDDPEEMRRLLDLGVDVIMTNYPQALAKVLGRRG